MKQAKNIGLSLLGFVLIGAGIYMIRTVPDPQGIMRALPFLLVGFGCGIFGHGLGDLLAKKAVQSDPAMARQLEIAQTDERNVMIGSMAKAKGYDMMTYVFGALMVAFALMGAPWTVIIPMVIAYLFVHGYAIYFRVKLEKEM
ncbi:MAG TPA: hypothetical protein H9739_01070 [Candidatus Agathobaculum pullistercoris]|nr:hypothetical protein [uncultured Agathobaculum sp.]HIX10157.1 hypothetical protein [Candidatus Agathobaculum pullistercoris]